MKSFYITLFSCLVLSASASADVNAQAQAGPFSLEFGTEYANGTPVGEEAYYNSPNDQQFVEYRRGPDGNMYRYYEDARRIPQPNANTNPNTPFNANDNYSDNDDSDYDDDDEISDDDDNDESNDTNFADRLSQLAIKRLAIASHAICTAITQQQQVTLIIRTKEVVNSKELKITKKKITFEPYVLGLNDKGLPIVTGNVVNENTVKEITIKVNEDRFNKDQNSKASGSSDKWSLNIFKSNSGKEQTFNLSPFTRVRAIENSHFDAPKDFNSSKQDPAIVRVLCQINPSASQSQTPAAAPATSTPNNQQPAQPAVK